MLQVLRHLFGQKIALPKISLCTQKIEIGKQFAQHKKYFLDSARIWDTESKQLPNLALKSFSALKRDRPPLLSKNQQTEKRAHLVRNLPNSKLEPLLASFSKIRGVQVIKEAF